MDRLWRDMSYALRMLGKNPGFAAVTILSVAVGIGATTAIFSVVHAVLIDPYPYAGADRIGRLYLLDRKGADRWGSPWYTMAEYLEVSAQAKTVESMIAFDRRNVALTGDGLPESVIQEEFSPNAFEFFGVPPLLGRTFSPKDPPAEAVGVLSYTFWQRHFSGRPDVIGQQLRLDNKIYTIIGVLPRRFTWMDVDVYTPMDLRPSTSNRVGVTIKIKPGITKEQVAAEFQPFHERFAKASASFNYPEPPFRTQFLSVNEGILGKFANTLLALMAAVGFLLLIACANVANLLLARATARQGEIAVRTSMGAGRGHILQQLLTESVVLSLAGGALGIGLAHAGVKAVVALMPEYSVPHEAVIAINWPVLWFAIAVSVLTGVLFGLAPALQLTRQREADVLKSADRGAAASSRGLRLRDLLIVSEVALSLLLLTGAGLAIRGLVALQQQKLGYEPGNVLTFSVVFPTGRYTQWSQRQTFFTEVLDRVRRIPGVEAVAVSVTGTPPWSGAPSKFRIDGLPLSQGSQIRVNLVSDGYRDAVRVPLLRGRFLDAGDIARARPVAVVTEDFIKKHFPAGQDPIGRLIRLDLFQEKLPPDLLKSSEVNDPFEIVGVVGTARNSGLRDEPEPALYVPSSRLYPLGVTVLARTASDPLALANAAGQAVQTVDANQPVTNVRSLEQWLGRATAYPRFATFLFGIFGVIGLTLAAIGIFSVVSYSVARRTREFGIRMALGARPSQVLQLVAGSTGKVLAIGLLVGIPLSIFTSRMLAGRIEGLGSADPLLLIAIPLVLCAAALMACYVPARSATRVQPMDALRHE